MNVISTLNRESGAITYPVKRYHMVAVYSVAHFIVDFACAFLMFRSIAGTPDGDLCVLLYNFCAFAMQMPLGIIADKWNRNFLFAAIGCVLVALSYALGCVPIAAVFCAGIGNGMFHIGGGIDVLNISEKKLSALGIFVSPGAFGIYYGTLLGRGNDFFTAFIPLTLIVATGLIFATHKAQKGYYPKNAEFSLTGIGSREVLITIACIFLVVCLRSYVGLALNFSWKSTGYWGTVLICAVVFGKTLGGFASDQFGVFKTSLLSLGIASLLFLFPQAPFAGVVAILLFNMTMPITLWAVAKILPGAKGFAFGLLTFGLFLGFLPVYLGVNVSSIASWLFTLISAVSLGLLLIGLRRSKL